MLHIKSTNYDKFFCIAGDCPESCCTGWQIMIDDESLARYREIVDNKLVGSGEKLQEMTFSADYPLSEQQGEALVQEADEMEKAALRTYLHEVLEESVDWEEGCFQHENGRCVLMTENGLCTLQRAFGEGALCKTCARYPRHMEEFDGVREWSLSLSCPEAARLILSRRDPLKFLEWTTDEEDDPADYEDFEYLLYEKLVSSREAIYNIIQDRGLTFREKAVMMASFATELQEAVDYNELFKVDAFIEELEGMKKEICSLMRAENAADAADGMKPAQVDGDPLEKTLFSKMFELEMLKAGWFDIVDRTWKNWNDELTLSEEEEIQAEQLLMFWVYTYFCGAAYDGWVYSKVMLAICSVWWIFQIHHANHFAGGIAEAAYRYAREIEHSDENLNALEEWFDHG